MTGFSNPDCRVECRSVPYRSGVIEIGLVHPGLINIEVFNIDPDKLPIGCDVRAHDAPLDAVTENTEVEMTVSEATRLIGLLRDAIEQAERVNAGKLEP